MHLAMLLLKKHLLQDNKMMLHPVLDINFYIPDQNRAQVGAYGLNWPHLITGRPNAVIKSQDELYISTNDYGYKIGQGWLEVWTIKLKMFHFKVVYSKLL